MKLSNSLQLYAEWWISDLKWSSSYSSAFVKFSLKRGKAKKHMKTIYGRCWAMAPDEICSWLCLFEAELAKEKE